MSHRRRQKDQRKIVAQHREAQREHRILRGLGPIIRYNTRIGLVMAGGFAGVQAFLPWTSSVADRLPFFVVGFLSILGAIVHQKVFN